MFVSPKYNATIGTKVLNEDTAISTCSHEAIEMLLSIFEAVDEKIEYKHLPLKFHKYFENDSRYPIHTIIGSYEEWADEGDIILTDEHYANNVDGLPNLPDF